MNKQELIHAVELWLSPNTSSDMRNLEFNSGLFTALDLIKQLDDQPKIVAQVADRWHEEMGAVLWWNFPVDEPPYFGTPLDDDFPKYKTHFTKVELPDSVEEVPKWEVKVGDLVVQKGSHGGKVYFVEAIDDGGGGIILVNGTKDRFFTNDEDRTFGKETLDYFYTNFRLLAKKENLESV